MIATYDQFTRQMRNRLKTTCMGLGLVRLLQDAKRFEEARTTLYMLEDGFQGIEANKPKEKGVIKMAACSSTKTEMRSQTLCLV